MKTIVACLLLFPFLAFSQLGTIKGTILCDTEDKGIIPEIGAEIFILGSKDLTKDSLETLMRIKMINDFSALSLINIDIGGYEESKNDPDLLKTWAEGLSKYGIKNSFNDPVYKEFDTKALKETHYLINNKNTIKTMTDGAGNFSVKVKPGWYSVLIKSKLTKAIFSLTEYDGCVKYELVIVKGGDEKITNEKFFK